MKHTVTIVLTQEDGNPGFDLSCEFSPEAGKNNLSLPAAKALRAIGVTADNLAEAAANGGIEYAAD